nr:hypothetical protein BaRGS_011751 [Batillaria attramentaria]
MDLLMEEEEEEEDEEDEDMFNAHKDSDISFMISKEMQQFGETVVKRLSSLLESQASESDSCLEDGRDGRSRRDRNGARPGPLLSKEDLQDEDNIVFEPEQDNGDSVDTLTQSHRPGGKMPVGKPLVKRVDGVLRSSVDTSALQEQEEQNVHQQDTAGFPEDTQPKLKPSFPSAESFLTESDTTENFSETAEHETTASSNRASTASTATDETLTSFKTRSTTDSAEFDEAHFMLPESLVFVRSVDEEDDHRVDDAVIESGNIVRRPSIPKELTKSGGSSDERPQKLRKKRRRQPASSYDNVTRGDLNEPEPKRGSKQIRDVIDAYCDEESEDSSDLSSSNDGACGRDVIRKSDVSRVECEPVHRQEYLGQQVFVRKPKPPADRSSGSSEEGDMAARRRLSSSSVDSSLRIPEIEETFSELMNVKTFLDDLEDRTPTADSVPVFVASDDVRAKDWSASHLRRSRMSPAKTDRTESDLDISEQRDDASTDSMYADDEDEGNEVVFQRSYSEEHGGEVLLSCTIYNSAAHDDGADSDDFWAESSAAEENYKKLETAADEAGSAFQNARIQMHDIHQHLQDLRRQMELLQDDITSTSLTLTPDYSLESCEPRPVTE